MPEGPPPEYEPEPMPEKSEDIELKIQPEIIIVEPLKEQELPRQKPAEQELTPAKINELMLESRTESRKTGLVHSIYYVYPSGLILEFAPKFDGEPSIESFTQLYSGNIYVPDHYDRERKGARNLDEQALQDRIKHCRDELTLVPGVFARTMSEDQKTQIDIAQRPYFMPANFYAVGFHPLLRQWIITFNRAEQAKSERSVFPLFHELGHIPYKSFFGKLVSKSFASLSSGVDFSQFFEKFSAGAKKYIEQIRSDLESLDPDLLQQLETDLAQSKDFPSFGSFEHNPEASKMSHITAVRRLLGSAKEKQDEASAQILGQIMVKESIFTERMADARAAVLAHNLRDPKHGGVDLEFAKSVDMRDYYHRALKTYVETLQGPRFGTGI